MSYMIGQFAPADCQQWEKLWQGYRKESDPPEVTEANWRTILSQDGRIYAFALRDASGEVQGFANCMTHYSTRSGVDEAYLMDLYVDQAHRGHGGGAMLVEHVIAYCKSKGFSRLTWITAPDVEYNKKFYTKFAEHRSWDRYIVDTR
jgi:GNAT superfamily N-acetyltransferase